MIYRTLIFGLAICFNCHAQRTFTGNLDKWDNPEANVLMIVSPNDATTIGSVDESGQFNIELTDALVAESKRAEQTQNVNSSGMQVSTMSLKKAFSSSDSTSLTVKNGSQIPTTLTFMGTIPLGNFEQKKMYGGMMASNSRAFAEAFSFYGRKDAKKGYTLNWYYLEEPASVKGTCNSRFNPQGEEMFDKSIVYKLDFKQGWNLIRTSLEETYTDEEGKTHASKWRYTTIDAIPDDTEYVFLAK